jgi:predicted nucleic acid-binding Zn ribbon protein
VGIATLLSVSLSVFVVCRMRAGKFQQKHRARVRRFSTFFMLSSLSMVLLVAFVVVLFVSTASGTNGESFFLWIEGLQVRRVGMRT